MTLSALLEELKVADPETYEALRNYPIYCSGEGALTVNLLESRNHVLVADALQGCIQRACERRGWWTYKWEIPDNRSRIYAALLSNKPLTVNDANYSHGKARYGDSPTEALLAAYIAAVKEERDDHNTARGG